ncbi:MAG: translation initiation factor IF-2 [bacterium]
MNVTELARILKITPQELRDNLPQFGFDIGQKAIKVNVNVANKIIMEWPVLKRKIEVAKQETIKLQEKEEIPKEEKILQIGEFITVRDFSSISNVPVSSILGSLMKNGIFASLNEKIDFETAWLIGSELGITVQKKDASIDSEQEEKNEDRLKNILQKEDKNKMFPKPPVIVVMGHVDHGKTLLLDAIRKTDVVTGEAGGITQHIGAYQIERNNKKITFIDTPGHEAFTAMRSRGAKIADVAILVVAADDGVKPQTQEAFQIIKATKIPFVVAINKIDKPEANIDKTKQELSTKLNITPEDWGGKTICAPISAKARTGIAELLDLVLLTAESESENLKANPDADAAGTIIESKIDKGSGPIATMLIQNGTIKIGDQLSEGGVNIGKVRNLYNYKGEEIKSAGPATPVRVVGLKIAPQIGDIVQVGAGIKTKHKRTKDINKSLVKSMPEATTEEDETEKINIIIKSDVLGSAEAIEESLLKINTEEVKVKIIHKGLGNVTEGDVKRAEASDAFIVAFNVKIPPVIEELARETGVNIKTYNIIYGLISDVQEEIRKKIKVKIEREEIGRLEVLAIFKTEKNGQIFGGRVISGRVEVDTMLDIMRDKEYTGEGKLLKLQSGKQDVNSVETGQECGIQHEGKTIIQKGDTLIFFKEKNI